MTVNREWKRSIDNIETQELEN